MKGLRGRICHPRRGRFGCITLLGNLILSKCLSHSFQISFSFHFVECSQCCSQYNNTSQYNTSQCCSQCNNTIQVSVARNTTIQANTIQVSVARNTRQYNTSQSVKVFLSGSCERIFQLRTRHSNFVL